MKKIICIILTMALLTALSACSGNSGLKTLEITDEMLDISAMGQLDNIFTSENRHKLISVEPEIREYYSEFHDYVNNIHEREDYTFLRVLSQIFADDANFYIEKTYTSDQADGRICQIGLSCQVQIPDGEFTEEELLAKAKETMNASVDRFKDKFNYTEDKVIYAPDIPSEYNKSFIWMDEEYKYSYNCRYVGGEKGDNDLCRITFTISSMEFLRKYHDDL